MIRKWRNLICTALPFSLPIPIAKLPESRSLSSIDFTKLPVLLTALTVILLLTQDSLMATPDCWVTREEPSASVFENLPFFHRSSVQFPDVGHTANLYAFSPAKSGGSLNGANSDLSVLLD